MFASIAPRYDLLNRLLSANIDRKWRRLACRQVVDSAPIGAPLLDLCTGTGDLALALAGSRNVVGCDFCHPMLLVGQQKASGQDLGSRPAFVEADTLQLPFGGGSAAAVTVAFGLRNLADYSTGLREMARVLLPDGVLAVLEFSVPTIPVFRQLYLGYFTLILPVIGRLVSGREGPYSYLPQSVREFPPPEALAALIVEAGFGEVVIRSLSGGIATLYLARRRWS